MRLSLKNGYSFIFFKFFLNPFLKNSLAKYDLSSSDIFEEIPLVVSNSSLVNAYLFELQESGNLNSNFKELELGTSPYLEKNFEALIENFDLLAKQQSEFEYYKRFVSRQQTAIEKLVFISPFFFLSFMFYFLFF